MPIANPSILTVRDLLTITGGFYIPSFQRDYAWSVETADSLINDLHQTTESALLTPDKFHELFIGTTIFFDNPLASGVGIKRDAPVLSFPIYDIIDGQQRITTFMLLAAVLGDSIQQAREMLSEAFHGDLDVEPIAEHMSATIEGLKSLQALVAGNARADPQRKPKVIRAHNASIHPPQDMWTLCGDVTTHYTSEISRFLQLRIEGLSTREIFAERLRGTTLTAVGERISQNLKAKLDSLDIRGPLCVHHLLRSERGKLLRGLQIADEIYSLNANAESEQILQHSLYLLAFTEAWLDKTQLILIKCDDIELAFDMFQSINAAGVPLTVLEVFKPDLVQKFGSRYGPEIQPDFETISKAIKESIPKNSRNKTDLKAKYTAEIVVNHARSFDGSLDVKKFFSVLRNYLKSHAEGVSAEHTKLFVKALASESLFFEKLAKLKSGSYEDFLTHILRFPAHSESSSNHNYDVYGRANEITLCVLILKELGHNYALALISVFYFKVRNSDDERRNFSLDELLGVCKASLAFFTLWKGLGSQKYPDSVYKSLFSSATNVSHLNGRENQTLSFVKGEFMRALTELSLETHGTDLGREAWASSVSGLPIYKNQNRPLAKFLLYLIHHDAAPDFGDLYHGTIKDGPGASNSIFNCQLWSANIQIEHISPKNQPDPLKYPAHGDSRIYSDPDSIHVLGNLTLLKANENAAVSDREWPEKLHFYWSLTNCGIRGTITEEQLWERLGIESHPPSLQRLAAGVDYIQHLAPLVWYGINGGRLTLDFINARSKHLAERAFDKLTHWLD